MGYVMNKSGPHITWSAFQSLLCHSPEGHRDDVWERSDRRVS